MPVRLFVPSLALSGSVAAGAPPSLVVAASLLSASLLVFFAGAPHAHEWIEVWRNLRGNRRADQMGGFGTTQAPCSDELAEHGTDP